MRIFVLLIMMAAASTLRLSQDYVCDPGYYDDTIKIGIPLTLNASSNEFYNSLNIRRGLEMIHQWLLYRREGIKVQDERWGIELYMKESNSETESILNITRGFLADKSVDFMFAPHGSGGLSTMSSQTELGKMLLLSPSSDAYSAFMNSNFNYTYRIQPPPGQMFKNLLAFSLKGARTVTYVCGNALYCNKYSISMEEQVSGNTTSSRAQVRKVLTEIAGLTVDSVLERELHDNDNYVVEELVNTVEALGSDILIIDDWDCSDMLSRMYDVDYIPSGIFLTDCGASVKTSSSDIDFLTTFKAIDFSSTVVSPVSDMSPLEFAYLFEAMYRSPPTIEAAYTFAMGEILVSAIEAQANIDKSLCKNGSALSSIFTESVGFYTILSEGGMRFSNDKMGNEDLPLVQRNTGNELIYVDSISLVYPNPQSLTEEEDVYLLYELLYDKGLAFLPTFIVTLIFMLTVLRIYTMREKLQPEEKKLVVQLKFSDVPGFSLRGFGLSSEFFLVVDMIAYGSVRSAMIVLGFRCLHTFLSLWYFYKIFGKKNTVTKSLDHVKKTLIHSSKKLKAHVDRVEEDGGTDRHFAVALLLSKDRMLKANKLYSFILFLALFDVQALTMLPWKPSDFTEVSGGSPNLTMTGRILTVTVVHSIAVTATQLMFLRNNYDLHMSPQTRALFVLNAMVMLTVASVNLFSYFTKLSLLEQKQRALNFSLEHESIINKVASTKLETLDAYKENPAQFMKNLQAMFNLQDSLEMLADSDKEDGGWGLDEIYEDHEDEAVTGEGTEWQSTSALEGMLDIVEEVNKKKDPHKPMSRRKSRAIITKLLETSNDRDEKGNSEGTRRKKKDHKHKKHNNAKISKVPAAQANPLHLQITEAQEKEHL